MKSLELETRSWGEGKWVLLKDTQLRFKTGKAQIFNKWKMTSLTTGHKEDQTSWEVKTLKKLFNTGKYLTCYIKKEL